MASVQLKQGPKGGLYYVRNGKKIYEKDPESPAYIIRRQAQPTTGWHDRAPKKGHERNRLYDECDAKGKTCFLNPSKKGFPICPACRDSDVPCSCEPDCGGITAAYVRARQWGYDDIAKNAQMLKAKYGCGQKSGARGQHDPTLPGVYYEPTGRFSQAYCPQPPPCPQDKPLQYKMRGQDKYCCRKHPTRRIGPQKVNPWIEFRKQHKGQQYTLEELRKMYQQSK